jgi:hypothetical protein
MGTGNAADAARKQQQQQQATIEAATGQINNAFAGFTPQFYQDRTAAYEKFANPQLTQQYQNVNQNLSGKLANQGLLNSSAGLNEQGALQQTRAQQQQGIANQGIAQSQQLQQQVAQEKNQLIAQANAASNPLSVAQGALGTAASFAAPNAFAPLGNMFQTFANTYLGNQLSNTYNPNLSAFYLGGNKSSGLGSSGF